MEVYTIGRTTMSALPIQLRELAIKRAQEETIRTGRAIELDNDEYTHLKLVWMDTPEGYIFWEYVSLGQFDNIPKRYFKYL